MPIYDNIFLKKGLGLEIFDDFPVLIFSYRNGDQRNGANARGHFTWSFLDVFELMDGYDSAYGLS